MGVEPLHDEAVALVFLRVNGDGESRGVSRPTFRVAPAADARPDDGSPDAPAGAFARRERGGRRGLPLALHVGNRVRVAGRFRRAGVVRMARARRERPRRHPRRHPRRVPSDRCPSSPDFTLPVEAVSAAR